MNDVAAPLFPPGRWREVRAALERIEAAEDSSRALEALGATDPELARAVRALLADRPDETALHTFGTLMSPVAPALIGAFKPLSLLGTGGMGRVYLAERRGPDFMQHVALKLLDAAGPDVAHLIARERGILATLTHPNVAAFIDAGIDEGQAWLAMEYVDGEPLLDDCERLHLDTAARVRLFDQVCAAVAHAHAKLVVHRDLKPSNVLINRDGTVKLLDFGIATVVTADQGQQPATRVFTPEYAAPEQLRGERATTATDIYALGLMLYELITGRRLPTVAREGGSGDWTTAELARFATTAPDASTKIRVDKTATQQLRGDLGRIISHALAFEPEQRYATVAQMRDDLSRWLDHRPLSIGRQKFSYVAARFVRRHRVAIALAAIAVFALIGTSVFALWEAQQARQMAVNADHAKNFLGKLFTEANPYIAKRSGKSTVELLQDAAQRLDSEFVDAPEVQIELRSIMSAALLNLEQYKLARDLAQRNVDQLRETLGPRAPQVGDALATLAEVTEKMDDIHTSRAQWEQAYELLRDAGPAWARDRINTMSGLANTANLLDDYAEAQRWDEAVLREQIARDGPESRDVSVALMNLSANLLYQEHFEQSEKIAEQARVMTEHVFGPGHAESIYVDNSLGAAQFALGRYSAALETFQRAATTIRGVLPPKSLRLAADMSWIGRTQFCLGDDAAAETTLREALSIAIEGNNQQIKGVAEFWLGLLQLRSHRDDAAATLRSAVADLHAKVSWSPTASDALWAQAAYGAALAAKGDIEEGERQARQARDAFKASKFAGSYRLAEVDRLLADILQRKGATDEARALRQEALATYTRVLGAEHPRTKAVMAELN